LKQPGGATPAVCGDGRRKNGIEKTSGKEMVKWIATVSGAKINIKRNEKTI